MEDNNELKDIILDKESDNKSFKVKKILVTFAVLVIIFLIVLIVMKVINGDKPDIKKESLILPPEPMVEKSIKNDEIFEQVPIVQKEITFDEMIGGAKIATNEDSDIQVKEQAGLTPTQEPLKPAVKEEPKKETVQKAITPKVVTKQEPVTKAQPPKQAATSKVATTKPKAAASKDSSVANGVASGTYVQVLSVSKFNPEDKFMKNILAKGYKYHVYKTSVNNKAVYKILIGPYSQNEIKAKLEKIRADIASGAFVFRVK